MWPRISEFITLFVVVDPLAASSVFLAVTAACDAATKRRIASLSVVVSFGVLLFFIVLGQIIVEAMVAEVPRDKPAMPAMPGGGGMGGMGGMDF